MDSFSTKSQFTVDDLSCLGETNVRIELISGELVLPFGPDSPDERVSLLTSLQIDRYVYEHDLGIVFPIDVVTADGFSARADISFFAKGRNPRFNGRATSEMPDLFVEICEDESSGHDRSERFLEYIRRGTKEYWIVFIETQRVEVLSTVLGKATAQCFSQFRKMSTALFPNANFNVNIAFA